MTQVQISASTAAQRGYYNEITAITVAHQALRPADIVARFKTVLPETFAEFDKKKRGDALNVDLYGYDPEQGVAIVQIRHAFRQYKNGFLNVHKDYVLVGANENGNFFRHPISAHTIHAGIRKDKANPVAPVRAAQRWMWGVTDRQLAAGIRQGDVLMVPVRGKPANAETIAESVVLVGGTHEVHARAFVRDAKGVVYAEAPTIRHTKGQHLPTYGDGDGWHAIKIAKEADTWEWGARLGD